MNNVEYKHILLYVSTVHASQTINHVLSDNLISIFNPRHVFTGSQRQETYSHPHMASTANCCILKRKPVEIRILPNSIRPSNAMLGISLSEYKTKLATCYG